MTSNDLADFDIAIQPQQNQAPQPQQPIEPQPIQNVEQPQQFMQNITDKMTGYGNSVMDWIKANQQMLKQVGIVIIILLVLIVVIKMISKHTKENFIYETPNGQMTQETIIIPGKGAVSTVRYGGQEFSQEVQPSGVDMRDFLQNDASIAALKSGQQAEISLKKELYNGIKQQDDPEIQGNIQESPEMQMLQHQNIDSLIEQERNITNNKIVNDLNVLRQITVSKQMPLQDVNELEQMNRDVQVSRDHSAMIQSARGAGIFVPPNDPNESIKMRQRYTVNSNRPGKSDIYGPMDEKIKEQIEYKVQFDTQKEAALKLSGPSVKLPDMTSVEKNMQTTTVTSEPVVQTDKQKVILSQTVIESPNVQGQKLVEKTVNPEIIAKVEESYKRWPVSLVTREQKEAAGQFMTILVLLRHSGQQIPTFGVLVQKFPEIQKMKQSGMFKGFDKNIVKWAEQQIESVKKGEKSLDNIISQFKTIYQVDPVQNTVVGDKKADGTVSKTSTQLETTPSSQKGTEKFMSQNGKRKFIVKQERYTIQPGYGIRGKQTVKSTFIV